MRKNGRKSNSNRTLKEEKAFEFKIKSNRESDLKSYMQAIPSEKIRINGNLITKKQAKEKYPEEYAKYRRGQRKEKNRINKINYVRKIQEIINLEYVLDNLELNYLNYKKRSSQLSSSKELTPITDCIFEAELGEGNIEIFLRINPGFKKYNDLKNIKWIMTIDSIINLDGAPFEGLFDPEINFSEYLIKESYISYSQNKFKFTVGFQDDFKLYTFVHILNLIVQKENSANTFKQRIQCSPAVVNPSYDRPDSAGIQVPETPNNGR